MLYIKDLVNVKENNDKRSIDLTFIDENNQTKNVFYEAKTKIECSEICTKLRERLKIIQKEKMKEQRKSVNVTKKIII